MTQAELEEALRDAVAHLAGAASAYRTYAKRYSKLRPRAETDAFFSTRVEDMDRAVERGRAVLIKLKSEKS